MLKKILILFLFPCSSFAQSQYFEKVYGTSANDVSRSVKQIAGGSIFVLGNSDAGIIGGGDVSLTKLNSQGVEQWTMYYGTPSIEDAFYLNLTSDGNLVFVAETETSSNNLDILIYKVDTTGAVIWNKTFASTVNENAKYIEQTSDGGYILCGAQNDSAGYYDILVVKLDQSGNEDWHTTHGRTQNDYSDMIHQVGQEYILTADTRSYGAGGYDVILYKLDSTGNEIWVQTYGDSLQNGCQGVLVVSDGSYLSYGETEIFPSSPFDFYLEKISPTGSSIWRYTYGGNSSDAFFSVKEDADGGFVCTGYTNSYNGGGPLDLVIMKVDSSGNFQWKQTYGGNGIDIGFELIHSVNNDGYIITGKTFDTSDQYYLLKLNNNGLVSNNDLSEAASEYSVFPNPVSNELNLFFISDEIQSHEFMISDIYGNVVLKGKTEAGQKKNTVQISGFSAGIYFCSVIVPGRPLSTRKIIKY